MRRPSERHDAIASREAHTSGWPTFAFVVKVGGLECPRNANPKYAVFGRTGYEGYTALYKQHHGFEQHRNRKRCGDE
jgi:hypothetical protein